MPYSDVDPHVASAEVSTLTRLLRHPRDSAGMRILAMVGVKTIFRGRKSLSSRDGTDGAGITWSRGPPSVKPSRVQIVAWRNSWVGKIRQLDRNRGEECHT